MYIYRIKSFCSKLLNTLSRYRWTAQFKHLSVSITRYFYEFTKILLISETDIFDRIPIWVETDRRPTFLSRDTLKTDMPDRRPTFLIWYRDMPGRRSIGDRHALLETHKNFISALRPTKSSNWFILHKLSAFWLDMSVCYRYSMRHVRLRWVSD